MMKLFLVILFSWTICLQSCIFSPGSYPYAEKYVYNLDDSSLVDTILEFKHKNPSYFVPESIGISDGASQEGNWYFFYFYFKEKDIIMLTWVRSIDENHSNFALVGINKGMKIGNWKEVNHDLDYADNVMVKDLFQNEILKKIGLSYGR